VKPWHKITTKTEWDKTCASACAAARVEVPAALQAARDAEIADLRDEDPAPGVPVYKKGKKG
jgi:hypothetical protein